MPTDNSTLTVSDLLAKNLAFTISNYLIMLMGFVSAVLNVVLVAILTRAKHLDQNVTVLLGNMSVAAAVGSAYQFVKCIYIVIQTSVPNGLVVNSLKCKLIETIYMGSGLTVIWSAMAMGIDRLVATKNPDAYRDEMGKVLAALVGLMWILSTAIAFTTATVLADNSASVAHCSIIFISPLSLITAVAFITVINELGLASLFVSLWFYNRRYLSEFGSNVAKTSLRARFQLHRNMRAARMMVPSVVVHCCMWLSIAIGVVASRNSQMPPVDLFLMGQFGCEILVLLHALLHPLICVLLNAELMIELKSWLHWGQSAQLNSSNSNELINGDPVQRAQGAHFEVLTKTWATK